MSDDTDTQESTSDSADSADSADSVGIEESGFESKNNSRDETQAIMNAESPDDIDKDLLEEIESERQERLDPDNRPENAEVDNTQRTFIAEEARFEDTELSEEEQNDGLGQKEPDPETQAGTSDDEPDTDAEGEATEQEAESDASTGPAPTESGDEDSDKPGKHKA